MAAILCYVTDRAALPAPGTDTLLGVIRRAIAAGVDWIQLREKNLTGRALAALARDAVAAAHGSSTRIVINGRVDVAVAARAGGVHLGGVALPVEEVAIWCAHHLAEIAPPFLVGASCHSFAEARAAERDGAHYIFFGPVFSTPAKTQYGPPQGISRLEEVCRAVRIPVLAIGGVTLSNAQECLRAGAAGIAAIRLFQESEDLRKTVAGLRGAL